jgi:hypothetical protein
MKENIKESSFSQNDYPNGSSNKNNIASGSNKIPYQKLFSENPTFNKIQRTKKCNVKKISLILAIISIILIATILFIIAMLYSKSTPTKISSKQSV